MLAEGRNRAASGERVVIGWLETHGRAQTDRQAEGLEVIEPQLVEYRGSRFPEFDPAAAIASGADVVLVDELAHMSPDRSRQRWEDVADVLAAGLDVVTTANVAHLRSVRDYAAQITGVGTVASVPDEFVRSGDVVLVDMPADALRRRIASGSVYSAEQVGGALADYFRAANLAALSELGRAWMDGTAEDLAEELLARLGLAGSAVPPVVLAADSGSASGRDADPPCGRDRQGGGRAARRRARPDHRRPYPRPARRRPEQAQEADRRARRNLHPGPGVYPGSGDRQGRRGAGRGHRRGRRPPVPASGALPRFGLRTAAQVAPASRCPRSAHMIE